MDDEITVMRVGNGYVVHSGRGDGMYVKSRSTLVFESSESLCNWIKGDFEVKISDHDIEVK